MITELPTSLFLPFLIAMPNGSIQITAERCEFLLWEALDTAPCIPGLSSNAKMVTVERWCFSVSIVPWILLKYNFEKLFLLYCP